MRLGQPAATDSLCGAGFPKSTPKKLPRQSTPWGGPQTCGSPTCGVESSGNGAHVGFVTRHVLKAERKMIELHKYIVRIKSRSHYSGKICDDKRPLPVLVTVKSFLVLGS